MTTFEARSLPVDAVVVTAMEEEAEPFLQRASVVSEPLTFGKAVHRSIEVDGLALLLVTAGIGLVNGAAAAAEAVLRTAPAHPESGSVLVVSAGSAGGVGATVSVGEVVVGTAYVNADADARVFGYEIGQTPQMPATYAGDPGAVAAALGLSLVDGAGAPLPVRSGLIVSSDGFVSGGPAVAHLRSAFPEALATDMESLAMAQVCTVYGAPFVSIRGISDLADPSATDTHLVHVDDASDRSARVVLGLLAER